MYTYKTLNQLVLDLIKKHIIKDGSANSLNYTEGVLPYFSSKNIVSDDITEIILELVNSINKLVKPYIDKGLEVIASDPPDSYITVTSGAGIANGHYLETDTSVKLYVPLDINTDVFYVTFNGDQITIEQQTHEDKISLAKIVIPNPGTTVAIQDDKPLSSEGSDNGWIVSGKDVLFDGTWEFDDDSIAALGNKLDYILADNIFGTLKLSENLQIANNQGTMVADSNSLKFYYNSGNKASQFDRYGVRFYDESELELAKFTNTEARVGNIIINTNDLRSGNFITGASGFRIRDTGSAEFEDVTIRGEVNATSGVIGGWSIDNNKIYSNTTGSGIIQGGIFRTNAGVGMGANGVIMDIAGVRGYSSTLGLTFNIPTNGEAPFFSNGTISESTFEINTNSVLRTSNTVGDGTANSNGILINNTGIYGCGANQSLINANLKATINGDVVLRGTIVSTSGQLGSVTIDSDKLSGGLIEGSLIRASSIETSTTLPKVIINNSGISYQVSSESGIYGEFLYGDGTLYGSGYTAKLFDSTLPIFAVLEERTYADIRLVNRSVDPASGTHQVGDLICVGGKLKICTGGGSPGTFTVVGAQTA